MASSDATNRVIIFAIGLLVLLGPVVILGITLAFLVVSEDFLLGQLTPLEFLELYTIDLIPFAVFAYGLYRLTLLLVENRLPDSLDALEASDAENGIHEESDDLE